MEIRKASLIGLLSFIEFPNNRKCENLLEENWCIIKLAPGSSKNHQDWEGGYLDHICETMDLAKELYPIYNHKYELDFSLSDSLLVLFLHDLEKPWKYSKDSRFKSEFKSYENYQDFQRAKLVHYGIKLNENHKNALKYIHGEGTDYSKKQRVQLPLAAFCHICDISSARIGHNKVFFPRNY